MKYWGFFGFLLIIFSTTGCGGSDAEFGEFVNSLNPPKHSADPEQDPNTPEIDTPTDSTLDKQPLDTAPVCAKSLPFDHFQPSSIFLLNCASAQREQIKSVDKGNSKKDQFLARCYNETNNSCWCDQLIRPNPESLDIFRCTYGRDQVHQLIHPDESTWKYAIEAVKIIEEFERINIFAQVIYNWWRPEPYNKNVGGSATRHPHGTSIDVRFPSVAMQDSAFFELCKMREEGRIRAIGYYFGSPSIHFGVGDHRANTWGKSCP